MKKLILFCSLTAFIGCVKDPYDLSPNEMFSVTVNKIPFEQATFFADNSTKYKIELRALDGIDFENDKEITLSVSDGGLAATSDLSSTGNKTITSVVEGGNVTVYYVAGRNAQNSALFSITLSGLSQVLNFTIKPSEPDKIKLAITPLQPTTENDLILTAYAIKTGSNNVKVSDNLQISFSAHPVSPTDQVEPFVNPPFYGITLPDTQTGLENAKIMLSTNKKPGKIMVVALYTKSDGKQVGDSSVVEFTQ